MKIGSKLAKIESFRVRHVLWKAQSYALLKGSQAPLPHDVEQARVEQDEEEDDY